MIAIMLAFVMVFPVFDLTDVRVETVAGTGLPGHVDGEDARFNMPFGIVAIDEDTVVVFDTFNNLIRQVQLGETSTVTGQILDMSMFGFPSGHYLDGTLEEALFSRPMGGAVDVLGRLFIACSDNHSIRVVSDSNVYTLVGSGVPGFQDGVRIDAQFNHPSDISFKSDGTIVVADTLNHVIRRINVHGEVSVIAGVPGEYGYNDGAAAGALFNSPMGVFVTKEDVIYVADTGNHLIRRIEAGVVTTLAGQLLFPEDIDWDEEGDFDHEPIGGFMDGKENLFNLPTGIVMLGDYVIVADSANHRIRAIAPDGTASTIAGNGQVGDVDGSGSEASFHFPRSIAVWENMMFVADTGNNQIRVIFLEVH